MQAFAVVALFVILGGMVLAWPLRRVSRKLGDALSLVGHLAARLAVVVLGGWTGVLAVEHGTVPYVAFGVVLFVVAAAAGVMSVLFLVALVQTFRGDSGAADP